MNELLSVTDLPKTSTFQMRINPEVKARAEDIFSHCGLTLTDAVNIFIQQSINIGGMPLVVTQNSKNALKEQAIAILMSELQKGESSVRSESDLIAIEDIAKEFGKETK
ncbi:MAG: type II toxin-antitoxin system RelB/DinJ family antitoxin [Acutalibacteraceae bacterium]